MLRLASWIEIEIEFESESESERDRESDSESYIKRVSLRGEEMTASASTQTAARVRRIPAETILLVAVFILVAIGVLVVFDASFPMSINSDRAGHNPLFFGTQQAKGLFAGLLGMALAIRIGYTGLRRWAGTLMAAGAVLLCLVWAPHHIGIAKQHAARWVHLGLTFQPSEIAKLTLVMFLAHMLSRPDCRVKHLTEGIIAPLAAAGLYMLLIFAEPDLGTALVVFATFLTMILIAGARKRHVAAIILLAPIVILARGGLKPGQLQRIQVFAQQGDNPTGPGYQTFHSKLAIGSGQYTGVGWGAGREKYYLPEANSDFIFATIGEELGFVGTTAILVLFALVSWCGFTIARQTEDPFGRLLAVGLTALITWQALINVAVVTISIPATGVPLPFISYGSTSLVLTLISVGLLVSISQNSHGVRFAPARTAAH